MAKLFISYRGQERSRVREIEEELETAGLCHELIDDIDDGDFRNLGFNHVWEKLIKPKLSESDGLILLIGDSTHSPKITMDREIKFAKSQPWYIFGITLSNRSGGPPADLERYSYFISLEHDADLIVNEIESLIDC